MNKTQAPPQSFFITTSIALLCCILWGTPYPTLKIIYKEMGIASSNLADNITLISLRFILAGVFLFVFGMVKQVQFFKLKSAHIRSILFLGLFNTTLQYFFFNIGINNTSGIKASILGQSSIFLAIVLAHFLDKNDKLNFKKAIGLLLGFGGLILINLDHGRSGLLSFSFLGEGFMIISGLTSALSMFIAKRIGEELPSLVFTAWQMFLGAILLFFTGLFMGGNPFSLHFTPLAAGLLIYLSLVSSIAFYLWYSLLQYRAISELSMFKFIIPITGSLLTGIFIPGELLLPVHFIALLLVCIGIIIVNKN